MTTLEVAGCITGILLPLYLSHDVLSVIAEFVVAISGITLFFSLLLVYGVATEQSVPILIYLGYKAILIFVILLLALAADLKYLFSFQYVFGLLVITNDNYICIIALFYVFSSSFSVLHYNILVVNKSENIQTTNSQDPSINLSSPPSAPPFSTLLDLQTTNSQEYSKDSTEHTINHI